MTQRELRNILIAVAGCGLAVVLAAAKTKITTAPEAKGPPEGPPRKILVLVVSPDPDVRSGAEDAITGELSLRGANAVASFVPFPQLPKERGPFEKTLVADGFDAVTVSRLVGKDDKVEWTPGMETYAYDYVGMGPWGGYWYTYQKVFVPGYLSGETAVRVRTDLWRTAGATGKLMWSGTTETYEPTSVPQITHDIGVAVARALARAKLI
jgi:hypothetical protein